MLRKLLIGLMVVILCGVAFHELGAAINAGPKVATTFTFYFRKGWSLMSVPVSGFNPNPFYSFPTAYDFFRYWDGTQYKIADTMMGGPGLAPGKGYWVKYQPAQNYTLTDQGSYVLSPLTTVTINVDAGWNMIGSIYTPAPLDLIVVVPELADDGTRNVSSSYFGYEANGYYPVLSPDGIVPAALQPGKGYWVKLKKAGTLTLKETPAVPTSGPTIPVLNVISGIPALSKLTISDSAEGSMKLYYGIPALPIDRALAEMPSAMTGAFDARFEPNDFFKTFAYAAGQTYIIKVSSATYPLTLAWDVKQANLYPTRIYYSGTYKDINGTGSITISGPVESLVLRVGIPPPPTQPPTCFLKGTPILMADGKTKAIEEVKVGDTLLAFDEATKSLKPDKVKQTFAHETDQYLIVNGHLNVTSNHIVYSKGKWVEIGKLNIGDSLLNAQGKPEKIASIQVVKGKAKVYNLEVNPYHTYVAGGIVAHNRKATDQTAAATVN